MANEAKLTITLDKFKEKYPDLFDAVFQLGRQAALDLAKAEKLALNNQLLQASKDMPVKEHVKVVLPEGPEKWKAEFERNPDLEKEYGSVDAYIGYRKADKEGRVRRLKRI